jgi:hypothetical protein
LGYLGVGLTVGIATDNQSSFLTHITRDRKRFVARSDEKLTAFLELERVSRESLRFPQNWPQIFNLGHWSNPSGKFPDVSVKILGASATPSFTSECLTMSENLMRSIDKIAPRSRSMVRMLRL